MPRTQFGSVVRFPAARAAGDADQVTRLRAASPVAVAMGAGGRLAAGHDRTGWHPVVSGRRARMVRAGDPARQAGAGHAA